MLNGFMYSPVGFGNYGNIEYGFGQGALTSGAGAAGGGLTSLFSAECDCPINPKTGQPGKCEPDLKNMSSVEGITYDEKGCPVLQVSEDGSKAEILVDESKASSTAKEYIRMTRAQPDIKIISHQNWFAKLPLEQKLAVFGVGFGALLVLIFALKA